LSAGRLETDQTEEHS